MLEKAMLQKTKTNSALKTMLFLAVLCAFVLTIANTGRAFATGIDYSGDMGMHIIDSTENTFTGSTSVETSISMNLYVVDSSTVSPVVSKYEAIETSTSMSMYVTDSTKEGGMADGNTGGKYNEATGAFESNMQLGLWVTNSLLKDDGTPNTSTTGELNTNLGIWVTGGTQVQSSDAVHVSWDLGIPNAQWVDGTNNIKVQNIELENGQGTLSAPPMDIKNICGYYLAGWKVNGSNYAQSLNNITLQPFADYTLVADWQPRIYEITIDATGSSVEDNAWTQTSGTSTYTATFTGPNESVTLPPVAHRTGYTFNGWENAPANNVVNAAVVETDSTEVSANRLSASYCVKWDANTYTVKLYNDDTCDESTLLATSDALSYGDGEDSKVTLLSNDNLANDKKPYGFALVGWRTLPQNSNLAATTYNPNGDAADKPTVKALVDNVAGPAESGGVVTGNDAFDEDGKQLKTARYIKLYAVWQPVYNIALPLTNGTNSRVDMTLDVTLHQITATSANGQNKKLVVESRSPFDVNVLAKSIPVRDSSNKCVIEQLLWPKDGSTVTVEDALKFQYAGSYVGTTNAFNQQFNFDGSTNTQVGTLTAASQNGEKQMSGDLTLVFPADEFNYKTDALVSDLQVADITWTVQYAGTGAINPGNTYVYKLPASVG
ncbi:hypothetical protein [Adlercreutzia sp. ZJ154]|uniref:hypothetical protein n=1 Tax=Adlercreutzia sp. ZJ154 TaxID=2709790 RepID=UPI0013EA2CE8|nr:hypothetical protein [Adlercreutzia sp. ZJ154]